MKLGVNSEIQIMMDLGRDPEKVLDQRKLYEEMLAERGLEKPTPEQVVAEAAEDTDEEKDNEAGQSQYQ